MHTSCISSPKPDKNFPEELIICFKCAVKLGFFLCDVIQK